MEQTLRNRSIALAGVFQAAGLVRQLAHRGQADRQAVHTLIASLFTNDAPDIKSVYATPESLQPGFKLMAGVLTNPSNGPESREIARYTIGLLHLQRQLNKKRDIASKVIAGIADIEQQKEFFDDLLSPTLVARLAALYKETISKLGPRIMVQGEQAHLNNPNTADEIRALLLAGIRAAVLWEQAGGNRWRLMLQRKKMVNIAKEYLR